MSILDEADQLEEPSLTEDRYSLPQFAIICISNDEELFDCGDDRLVSHLRSSEHVRMEKYCHEHRYDVLGARAAWGLEEAVVTDERLYRIADAVAGDARLTVGMLRSAAGTANRKNRERITEDILLDAAENARTRIEQRDLDSLTLHQQVTDDIVRNHGPFSPNEIHCSYSTAVDGPWTKRTARKSLSKMGQYNLHEAEGRVGIERARSSIRRRRLRFANPSGFCRFARAGFSSSVGFGTPCFTVAGEPHRTVRHYYPSVVIGDRCSTRE